MDATDAMDARHPTDRPARLRDPSGLRLDWPQRRVTLAGHAVALTRSQFLVLDVLLRCPNVVVTHAALAAAVWGEAPAPNNRAVGSQVARLRGRLRRAAADAGVPAPDIRTIRGRGYCLPAADSCLTGPDGADGADGQAAA